MIYSRETKAVPKCRKVETLFYGLASAWKCIVYQNAGKNWRLALFLDLGQHVARPGQALDQCLEKLPIETQLAGIRQLFKLHILNPQ